MHEWSLTFKGYWASLSPSLSLFFKSNLFCGVVPLSEWSQPTMCEISGSTISMKIQNVTPTALLLDCSCARPSPHDVILVTADDSSCHYWSQPLTIVIVHCLWTGKVFGYTSAQCWHLSSFIACWAPSSHFILTAQFTSCVVSISTHCMFSLLPKRYRQTVSSNSAADFPFNFPL